MFGYDGPNPKGRLLSSGGENSGGFWGRGRGRSYAGPDPKGRMLSSGKVKAIGVVPVGDFGITLFFTHEYNNAFLGGVAQTCEERGVGLSLVSGREDQAASGIKNALVDGFIFNSLDQIGLIEPAKRRRLPVVVMDIDGGPDISSIRVDQRDGDERGDSAFARPRPPPLRHRLRPVPVCAPVFHPPSKAPRQFVAAGLPMMERMAGVADALAEYGLSLDDMPIMEACATPEEEAAFGSGAEALILDIAPEATAVIALSDGVALSVVEHAKKRGLSVPRDLSVVGFDDVAGAARSEPPLTTVRFSAFESGRLAAQMLLDGGPPRQIVLPVELIVRASTAPPRE